MSNFDKLYRFCGNCSTQAARGVVMEDITVSGDGDVLAGVCDLFEGNDTGDEPTKIGEGPDGTSRVASGIVEQ